MQKQNNPGAWPGATGANQDAAEQQLDLTNTPQPKEPPAIHTNNKLSTDEPEPWPNPVEGIDLLDELCATFRRYLVFSEGSAEILALWTVFTHIIEISPVAPRLAILSPTRRCGKTTLLALLIRLVRRPLPASNATPAVVFRVIDKHQPTLLIDEADTFLSERCELIGILNSGHTKDTAYILRSDGEKFEPRSFSTFAAIAIAQIGKLPPTLEDRSFVIWMKPRRQDEKVERFRSDRTADLQDLRRKATRWAADNKDKIAAADPQVPQGLNDRAADNWHILLAVADVAGGHWGQTARSVAQLVAGTREDGSELIALLHNINDIFDQKGVDRISSIDLCLILAGLDHRPWGEMHRGKRITQIQLAARPEAVGIQPKVIRIGSGTPLGYGRSWFDDAFARYPRPQRATSQQGSYINDLERGQSATSSATPDTQIETAPNPVADGAVDVADGVAVCQGEKISEINDVAGVANQQREDGWRWSELWSERVRGSRKPRIGNDRVPILWHTGHMSL